MHFARLVEQAGVDLVSRPICLYGAYIPSGRVVPESVLVHTVGDVVSSGGAIVSTEYFLKVRIPRWIWRSRIYLTGGP